MLKQRLAGVVVVKDNLCVQSIGFHKYLPIGKPEIAVEFLNKWGIDEIIYLDISATKKGLKPNFETIKNISRKCFVPLTVGGGINSVLDMQKLVKFGADKVAINSAVLKYPQLIREGAAVLGNQCLVVSIDIKRIKGDYCVFSYSDFPVPEQDPIKWVQTLAGFGAGEILLNNVDRDGLGKGYDLSLLRKITDSVDIPIIACGGAGNPEDFLEAFTIGKVNCAAAANFFHFTEHSALTTKVYLKKRGIDLRVDTQADYQSFEFDIQGRLAKMADSYLADQRFKYYPPETI